ncbi:MAG: ProQ/FINO family protein [Betaproteobacteria bacterium]
MTETLDKPPADKPAKARRRAPQETHLPVLEKLAAWYPQLFGAQFLPLKRGIFQELQQAHPDAFSADALKGALAQHTRSTRYLSAVSQGLQRHDLMGAPVETTAPEHVHHALLEVFRRRQARGPQDLTPTLRRRMLQAFEHSGLTPDAYAALVRSRDEATNQLLDEVLAEARAATARDEALLRAFEAASQSVDAFADMYGMDPRSAGLALERARRVRAATTASGPPTPV